MRRYGFLEEEKIKPKARDKAGELKGVISRNLRNPDAKVGLSTGDSSKACDLNVSMETGVTTDDSNKTITFSISYSIT